MGKLIAGVSIVVALLVMTLLTSLTGLMGYWFTNVHSDEVGIEFVSNQPRTVMGPGVYTDFGPQNIGQFKGITTIRVTAMQFLISDEEVLTKDSQRLGVQIQGTIRRPGVGDPQVLLNNWSSYRQFYTDDAQVLGVYDKDKLVRPGLIHSIGDQAAKVCIGDRTFADSVIGSGRDALGECISKELGEWAAGYGMTVANVVVPNFILSKSVQDQLDAVTTARLATQVANQKAIQATAEAERDAAAQRGAIAVEQGKVQERASQDAKTAALQTQALQAQRGQIEAQKNNELFSASRDIEIQEQQRQAAMLKAQADIAPETAKAAMMSANPAYVNVLNTAAVAAAYKNTDKVIMSPSNPMVVIGDSGNKVILQP